MTQIDECKKYVLERGYDLIGVFQDDYTGASMDRPALNKLRDLLAKQTIEVVVVYDIDRLARKNAYQILIEEEFHKLGTHVEYVMGQYEDTDEGRLQKQIRSSIAEYEKAKILERSKRGKRGKAQSGFVLVGARSPYGYQVISEPHKAWLEIDPEEAKIVRLVYDFYLYGDGENEPLSLNKIAKRLTEMGISTRGDKKANVAKKREACVWQPAMIRHILSNETYTGIWHYGKTKMIDDGKHRTQKTKCGLGKQVSRAREEWIPVEVPAIIDRAVFEMAQERIQHNIEQSARSTRHQYLLGRRLKCLNCGYTYVGMTRGTHQYYYCKGKQQVPVKVCNMPNFSAILIETAVWNWVRSLIEEPGTLIAGLEDIQNLSIKTHQGLFDRLAIIDQQIDDHQHQLTKLLDLYLNGDFPKEMLAERKNRLEDTLLKLKVEKSTLTDHIQNVTLSEEQRRDIVAFCNEIRPRLENSSFNNRRHLFDLLDVRGTLAVEDGEKVVYAKCKLVLDQQKLSLVATLPSSSIGGIEMMRFACPRTVLYR